MAEADLGPEGLLVILKNQHRALDERIREDEQRLDCDYYFTKRLKKLRLKKRDAIENLKGV